MNRLATLFYFLFAMFILVGRAGGGFSDEVADPCLTTAGCVNVKFIGEIAVRRPDLMQRALGTGLGSLGVALHKKGELEKLLKTVGTITIFIHKPICLDC